MTTYNLPTRQKECLEYIKAHIEAHKQSPSLGDIGKHMDITPIGARKHLLALEKKGFIKLQFGQHNSVVVL
jgi:repressor LexA